jgi:hypothetical protein
MKCPHCQTSDLKPTMIEEYLPAMGCATCHGSLVSLLYYRHWAETQKAAPTTPAKSVDAVETTDTTTAIRCPKCSRLMTKYKLTGSIESCRRLRHVRRGVARWRRMGAARGLATQPENAGHFY